MANYTYTDAVGTSRRRARQILIDNPSQPVGATDDMAAKASVTFIMEDRIILADGKEMFSPAGNMVVPINENTLAKLYPNYDVQTGAVNEDKGNRHGSTIVSMIMDALEDVFITEGMARDNPPVTNNDLPAE